MSNLYSNSIFWIDTDKVKPNPYQPRRDFDEARLQDLADSYKQYEVASTTDCFSCGGRKRRWWPYHSNCEAYRRRTQTSCGHLRWGISSASYYSYRRYIMMKLELAIMVKILQRRSFKSCRLCSRFFFRLANEFKFTHTEIAKK